MIFCLLWMSGLASEVSDLVGSEETSIGLTWTASDAPLSAPEAPYSAPVLSRREPGARIPHHLKCHRLHPPAADTRTTHHPRPTTPLLRARRNTRPTLDPTSPACFISLHHPRHATPRPNPCALPLRPRERARDPAAPSRLQRQSANQTPLPRSDSPPPLHRPGIAVEPFRPHRWLRDEGEPLVNHTRARAARP